MRRFPVFLPVKFDFVHFDAVPSIADIQLELAEKEVAAGNISGSVSWLMEGFNIEKSQWVTLFCPEDLWN